MKSALVVAVLLSGCAAPEDFEETEAALAGTTIVSLTFDVTAANNFQVGQIASARGMRATFYVNSSRISQPGWLTQGELEALEADGHEIGGHTISHARLAAISDAELQRQVCEDRVALLNAGFDVTTFAYPFSSQNERVREVAKLCGYNAARLVGGFAAPTSCFGCPTSNSFTPSDPFALRTNASVKEDTTLEAMQSYVLQAEQNGGGWVPMVFHHVCDGCNELAVSPATLAQFLDWLATRAQYGTRVATMAEVIGGEVKPGVMTAQPPVISGPNLLQNASFETDGNADQVPDCWQRGTYGTNAATYSLVDNAATGVVAQRIDVTSWTSGLRRIITRQDATCAPAATPGHTYTMQAKYIATAPPIFSVFYRSSTGAWLWHSQSKPMPTTSSYATAKFTTPVLPAGTTAISVGLSLQSAGSLIVDDFLLVDDQPIAATAITSPLAGATVKGITPIVANVADLTGVYRVRFYLDGKQLGTRVQTTYRWNWDTATTTVGPHQLAVQAEDQAGNVMRSSTITIDVVR